MARIRSRTKESVEETDIIKIVKHHFGEDIHIGEIKELYEGYL